jgi:uncharacterized protein YprB with RNaseH-like and TPR domain
MLTSTFIHLPGVGEKTERSWWRMGISSWHDWLKAYHMGWFAKFPQLHNQWRELIECSMAELENGNASFFAKLLPKQEYWRCYREFKERTVFLDIETTGCSAWDYITVVGIYDGHRYMPFVRGYNLHKCVEALYGKAVIVTFYGSAFDLPFLRRSFPNIYLPPIHIDLCYLLKRLGYKGGLKAIEWQLGISRDEEIEGLSGIDAVRLWMRYQHNNDANALRLLIKYNRADVVNLKTLMEFAYREMVKRVLGVNQCVNVVEHQLA